MSSKRGADPGIARTGLSPIFRALNSSADSTILTILNVRVWVCAWHAGLESRRERARRFFCFHAVSTYIRQRRFGKRRGWRVTTRAKSAESSRTALSHQRAVGANPPRPITLNARGPDQVLVFEMSQYVARATGMATKALDVAKTRVLPPAVEWYNATMAKNAQYVVKDPEAVDKLGKQLIFSNMAKLPAAVEAAQGEIKVVQQKWANRMELPMTEVRSRRPFAHRIRRARPASSFPRERCWQHRGTPENRDTPDSPPPLAHRRLAPPPSSPRRCTRGSASGKSSAEAGA